MHNLQSTTNPSHIVPAGQGRQASGLEAPSWLCTVPGGQGNITPRVSPGGQVYPAGHRVGCTVPSSEPHQQEFRSINDTVCWNMRQQTGLKFYIEKHLLHLGWYAMVCFKLSATLYAHLSKEHRQSVLTLSRGLQLWTKQLLSQTSN